LDKKIILSDTKITTDKILFFDMDGTLIDTNLANFLSYMAAINSITKSAPNIIYHPDKRFSRSNLKNAIPNLSRIEFEQIIQAKEEYYNDFLPENKLIKETSDILFKYYRTNKTILVTNCRKNRAMITLKYFGIEDKFSNIFCREFCKKNKKVNKFHNAIIKLGITPNLIIAFENEESEIADAMEAGIKIINPIIF